MNTTDHQLPTTPLLTVDIIIEMIDRPNRPIVFIERKNPPPGWALPGGFVDVGETLEAAAQREALEETRLRVTLTALLGCYSDPDRDPRMHTASAVYIAEATGDPEAADDARAIKLVDPARLDLPLAFDHKRIVEDYLAFRRSGQPTPLRP
jgi:8-oxo-dGTP diphosphatase